MSLSKKRHARKNTRATLSGRLVPAETPLPANPSWHEVVQPQPKQSPAIRDGLWYADVRDTLPTPESLHEVVEGTEFEGLNRSQRRARLRGTPIIGMYTKEMHFTLGRAWSDHREAKRLMRQRAAAARLEAKYSAVSS